MKENTFQECNVFIELIKKFEESATDFIEKISKDDKYIEAVTRFRDSMIDTKNYLDKIVTQNLKNLNLPTQEEVTRLEKKVGNLENKVNEIAKKIDLLIEKI